MDTLHVKIANLTNVRKTLSKSCSKMKHLVIIYNDCESIIKITNLKVLFKIVLKTRFVIRLSGLYQHPAFGIRLFSKNDVVRKSTAGLHRLLRNVTVHTESMLTVNGTDVNRGSHTCANRKNLMKLVIFEVGE